MTIARAVAAIICWASLAAAQALVSSTVLRNADGSNQRFAAVARFASCTGFFIETVAGAPLPSSPAYILTSGHCIDLDPQQVFPNRAPAASQAAVFNYFIDTTDRQVTFPATVIAYSTMKGGDLAVVELGVTYAELVSRGIHPLRLASRTARSGEGVVSVGIPRTGIPADERFLRRADCAVREQVNVNEFTFFWYDFYPSDCADIKGGSSGSPLMLAEDFSAIGITGTSTADAPGTGGDYDCYLNIPCELTAAGYRRVPETNYTTPIAGIAACFNRDGRFNAGLEGCPLDNGRQFILQRTPFARVVRPPATWNVTLTGAPYSHYRYKIVREGRDECRRGEGYGQVIAVQENARINDAVGPQDGPYFLCVQGGNSAQVDSTWQNPRYASVLHLRADSTPPHERIRYSVESLADLYRLSFSFLPPELSSYDFKAGAPGQVNCADSSGYTTYRRVPVNFPRAQGPYRICLVGEDEAGNRTEPLELLLDGTQILPFGIVNAASFQPWAVAPGQLISVYGIDLAAQAESAPGLPWPTTLQGVAATLVDSAGTSHNLRLLYVSPRSLNAFVPPGVAAGAATLQVRGSTGRTASAAVQVEIVSPGLFRMGAGNAAAAALLRVRGSAATYEPTFDCSSPAACTSLPISPAGADDEQLFLEIYGTGLRNIPGPVRARIGAQPLEVLYGGPHPLWPGVDQVNVRIPRPFRLRGFQNVTVEAGGKTSNPVALWFR